jgi:integrase
MKFTSKSIAALELPAGKSEHTVWDQSLPGFGIRLRPQSRTWRIQYRTTAGQQRSESLGDVRKVDLESARKIAKQRFAQVELGQDPGAERDAARRMASQAELTVGRIVERYLQAKQDVRPSTYRQAVRYLQHYAKPLHSYPLAEVKRAHVAAWVGDLARNHGRGSARDGRMNLSALFSWAMREGLAETNPVIGSNNPGTGLRPRARVLDDHELRIIWRICGEVDDDFCRILKLALLTACRRTELGGLRWEEVDLETGKLVLPGSRTKNHREHELMLPAPALAILRNQPRIDGRPWMFGRDGEGLTGWSWHKARFDKLVAEAAGKPLPAWCVHDTRRTAATRIAEFAPPHIVEALLNHAKPTLVATYNLATYRAEKAQALATWAEKLMGIVEKRPPRVLTLPQRA